MIGYFLKIILLNSGMIIFVFKFFTRLVMAEGKCHLRWRKSLKLFECGVIFHGFLLYADFFQINFFHKFF